MGRGTKATKIMQSFASVRFIIQIRVYRRARTKLVARLVKMMLTAMAWAPRWVMYGREFVMLP